MNIKIPGCSGGKTLEHTTTSFLLNDRILIDAGTVGITVFITHIKPNMRNRVIDQIDNIESEFD